MREKLRNEQGMTLVEMLCAVAILILLGLMMNTGLQMAMRSYRDITAQSEVQLLLTTLSDALADDLRYARDVRTKGDGSLLSYSSDSYNSGGRATLEVGENGQVTAGGKRVLPGGAYGNGAYVVRVMKITYASRPDGSFFTIELEVAQAEGTISARTKFTVRCLSGPEIEDAELNPGEESGG